MNLYKLTQTDALGYDTFDSCIVAAVNETKARSVHPQGKGGFHAGTFRTWASSPDLVTATLIGTAKEGTPSGVILASFNAG